MTGLRRDLSLNPQLLGSAFASWANYKSYMEDPAAPLQPAPLQSYSSDPVRRRYRIATAAAANGIDPRVAPVLTFFGLSFALHNDTTTNSPTKLQASARCVVGLWNPYSSALVPEDLVIVVTGLPFVTVSSPGAPARSVDLQNTFLTSDGTVKFALKFTPNNQDPDRSSWLPGRVYNWSALSSAGDPGVTGYATQFYERDATLSGSGVVRDAGPPIGPNTIGGAQQKRQCNVAGQQILTVELRRASTGETIGRFTSPAFAGFTTDTSRNPGAAASDFAYVFRLPESREIPAGETDLWLEAAGRDVREFPFPAAGRSGYIPAKGQEPNPALLVTAGQAGFSATYSQLLLDRYTSGKSYNEDVPVFELPRAPLLSLGSLQHLHVVGQRPFSVGNSWGGVLNRWFDQFFFSGLTADTTWSDVTKPLPNALLKVMRHKPDGTVVSSVDLNGPARTGDGYSSKNLVQTGTFNLNSVSREAWIAVLRGVRFVSPHDFTLATLDASTGTTPVTGGDATHGLDDPFLSNSRVAVFPRFGQSAQETFQADDGYLQSDPGSATNIINTPLFRRGIRTLSIAQVSALADKIAGLVRQKLVASGPFRTLEEFLSPSALFVGATGAQVSLLEKAIEDAELNTDAALGLVNTSAEFSSQWLTQADLMTALAPVLFPRSDTFVIRAYGEAVNPATGTTEGRAWCEATVQRVPEYFDKSQPEETAPTDLNSPNQLYGRRFRPVSFRWLTSSDI